MNLVIPPLFFYVVGAMLVIFGAARALWLGVRRAHRDIEFDPEPGSATDLETSAGVGQGSAAAAKARRRHLMFGVVWILMGIFLIVSTAGVLKFRFPS